MPEFIPWINCDLQRWRVHSIGRLSEQADVRHAWVIQLVGAEWRYENARRSHRRGIGSRRSLVGRRWRIFPEVVYSVGGAVD